MGERNGNEIKPLRRKDSSKRSLEIPKMKKEKKHTLNPIDKLEKIFVLRDFSIAIAGFFISRAMAFSWFLPFAQAFYASVFTERKALLWMFVTMGAILSHKMGMLSFKYILAIVLYTGFMLIIDAKWAKKKKVSLTFNALAFLISGGVWVVATGSLMYDTVMLIFETVAMVIGHIAMITAMPILYGKKRASATEDLVSIVSVAAIMLAGSSEFITFYGIDIANIVCIFAILTLAYRSDPAISTVCGLLIGLINSIGELNGSFIIGVYGLCGFLAGVASKFGKGSSVFAFICTNALMTIYVNGSTDVLINIYETVIASVVFFALPNKTFDFIDKYIPTRYNWRPLKSDRRTQELAEFKLSKAAESFQAVFELFEDVSGEKGAYDISTMVDSVISKVCSTCGMCSFCWKRDFDNTFSCISKIFESISENQRVVKSQISSSFKRHCVYIDTLFGTCERIYSANYADLAYNERINETKTIISRELAGMSAAFEGVSKQIREVEEFVPELERRIEDMFRKEGEDYEKICVTKDKNGRLEVNIKTKVRKLPEIVIGRISDICERDMIRIKNEGHITFIEKPRYSIEIGVSKARRDGEEVSGDSFTSFITENRKQVIVLSDGMGSGRKARAHSRTVIFLLKTFISAGFSGKTAVCLINSMFIAKNKDEMFSSLDVAVFDLDNACCEFIKFGGVKGFIASDKGVETVSGEPLPVGVMPKNDIEVYKRWLDLGESVFMVTDGVNDPDPKNPQYEDFLPQMIKKEGHKSPQIAAEALLNSAIKRARGTVMDDMTVVCAKIKRSA